MKIIDKIKAKEEKNEIFYSFEYFPPKTEIGVDNLLERIERMSSLNPLWVDITWGAGGSTSESTLFLSSYIQNYINVDCLMHLTCRCSSKELIDQTLEQAKKNGIVNILALRGDPPQGTIYNPDKDFFQSACDLVKYIRVIIYIYYRKNIIIIFVLLWQDTLKLILNQRVNRKI
jgi:methylenetetrahydrofolate reductase (NADPH)